MVRMPAKAFIWLQRQVSQRIDLLTFPIDLMAMATEARSQAAAQSGFAFQNDEVELLTRSRDNGSSFSIKRLQGRALVTRIS